MQINSIEEKVVKFIESFPKKGIFLTGIENSDPYVKGIRRNQLKEAFDFYVNYEKRLLNIRSMGIRWLRFGVPYSQTHTSEENFDFTFMDIIMNKCNELGINIISDLVHFGIPEWMHAHNPDQSFFQNPKFPANFAKYAKEFTKRYPNIRFFGLINEPFISANFSAKMGLWNEELSSDWKEDQHFVRAIKNIARASILARKEIERVWSEENRAEKPVFVYTESFEFASTPNSDLPNPVVERFNLRRFAALDLILGIQDQEMKNYLVDQGTTEEEYNWFMLNSSKENVLIGIDHYPSCIHIVSEKEWIDCKPLDPYQLYDIIKSYYKRYRTPMIHTEINGWPEFAVSLCEKTYEVISKLRKEGYPILGMSWYGDEYQVDWHKAMRFNEGKENPVGLFYKGEIQPVGILYREIINKGLPLINRDLLKTNLI